jgi:hypothetical protein
VVVNIGARPERGEAIVAGDVVNTASRLQQVAPVGGVVVGETTTRATGHVIDYEPLEPVPLKGKSEPVSLWLARGARSRFGVDVDQRSHAPLIGRDRELTLLQHIFERALEEPASSSSRSRASRASARPDWYGSCNASSTIFPISSSGARAAACPTARGSPSGHSARS